MAPLSGDSVFVAPAGYKAVPVKLSEDQNAQHFLYAKEHRVRGEMDKTHPENRTLFVINIPVYCTEISLSRIFSYCGPVSSVEMLEKPAPSVKDHKVFRYFSKKLPEGFKVAYVMFHNPSGIQQFNSYNFRTPLVLSGKDRFLKSGIHKWIMDYEASLVDVSDLQAEIDEYMQEFDKRVAEKEEKAREEEGVPDEDGWVTVTKKGRRPGLARTEAINVRMMEKEKKKRAQKELLNFYAWQHRNNKREHLVELRKKFEEDKQKIALMRVQRKFRPY